jgi:amino acid adenylation domain-containing protein
MSNSSRRSFDLSSKRKALLDAMLAEEGIEVSKASSARRISRREQPGPAPLSFAQQRLWFVDQFQPNSASYNIPIMLRLPSAIDVGCLERSLNEIVRRHEVLRTRFVLVGGVPMQEVLPKAAIPVPVTDLRSTPVEQRDAEVQRLANEEVQRPFDLANGPHLRAKLLRLGDVDHVLLLSLHHIVADGWSTGILLKELSTLYSAFISGKPSPLEELPIQYADFALWQRGWLKGENLESHLSYWKEHLAGAPAVLDMPTDRQRPAVQTFRGSAKTLLLSPAVTEGLRALSQREGATLFMTLLAAFNTLLHRYSRQEDIVIGSPIANRTQPELEGLLGPFANTLALRTSMSGAPTFRELLHRVRETTLGAYAHQDLPFEKLVEELQPERNLSYSPVFQVLFVLQNVPTSRQQAPSDGGSTRGGEAPLEVDTGTAKFDLTMSLAETPHGISGMLEYSTDLFEAATIERMVEQFQVLTAGIVANPDQPIWALPMLSERERRQVVVEWNKTRAPYPEDRCVHQMFEAQVERTPEAVALELGDERMSYRELNRRANQLAHSLRAMGIGLEDRVGICVERSFEMVIALLGVLKAGAVHTPLDPAYPKERLAYMLEDVNVRAVLTQKRLDSLLPPRQVPTIYLDADREQLAQQSPENPINRTSLDNLAYVIFTSGSTGRPKGVAMTHRPMANLFTWQAPHFQANAGVRTVQFTSFSFDVSFQEILSTLCTDGVLVLMPESLRRDFGGMIRFMAEKKIQRLYLPFTALHHLSEAGHALNVYPAHLQDIVSTGEQMHLTQPVVRFLSRLNGCVLHNQYGPTETHFATAYPLRGDANQWPTLPSIGRPISNTRIYIMDDHLQPVPIGVPGEVYIGGVMVAQGYLNHPEMTHGKFIPDPFNPELFPGEKEARIYKTGDLARFHADGNMEYLGRIDHQVKLRGFRIELGEIEAVLIQHPSVRDAVVALREDTPGDKRLVAYIVPPDGHQPSVRDLRAYLKEKLPEYMVPAALVTMEALPLTPNGKVDRRALRAPEWAKPHLRQEYVAPRSDIEKQLTEIWSAVLGVSQIGIYDNFFELGGHSLLATQVISRVRDTFHADLSLRRIFELPTVADLAVALVEGQARQTGEEEVARLLREVEQMSESDARAMLTQAGATKAPPSGSTPRSG